MFKNLLKVGLPTILFSTSTEAFDIPSKGPTFGQISKNAASGIMDGVTVTEAVLYIAGMAFLIIFISKLILHAKNSNVQGAGQQGPDYVGKLVVYFLATILCFCAPTFLGGSITTLFGDGSVTTLKPVTGPTFSP